jgi:hypothetical protein
MSLPSSRADEIDSWSARLLAIAGAVLLIEAVSGTYGTSLRGLPFSWLLTTIPFGIGFALAPLVVLRSYQYLADRTPTAAVVGVAFVAALPVGTTVLVGWGVLGLAFGPDSEITVLPVRVGTVFFALVASFALGVATFGLSFLRYGRTRLLGVSLLALALGWAVPLVVAKLSGVYPDWLANLLVVSVATGMLAIGHCFPPTDPESGG